MKPIVVAILAGLATASAVSAEPLRLAQAEPIDVLHPREVRMLVRSAGLMPIGQPILRGSNYVVLAIGDGDREVSVLVDARSGNILKIIPGAMASRMPPQAPPHGMRPGPGAIMPPDGPPPPGTTYGPYERITGPGYGSPPPSRAYRVDPMPDIMQDEPRVYGRRSPDQMPDEGLDPEAAAPPPGAPVRPGAPPRVITATPNPGAAASVPDQEANQEADLDGVPPTPADDGPGLGPSGALPPPPERFPQRMAPPVGAAKAKPAKRAAAVMPKQAPLPRPRPFAAAPPTAATPAAEPESETVAPSKPPAHSDMPN